MVIGFIIEVVALNFPSLILVNGGSGIIMAGIVNKMYEEFLFTP